MSDSEQARYDDVKRSELAMNHAGRAIASYEEVVADGKITTTLTYADGGEEVIEFDEAEVPNQSGPTQG